MTDLQFLSIAFDNNHANAFLGTTTGGLYRFQLFPAVVSPTISTSVGSTLPAVGSAVTVTGALLCRRGNCLDSNAFLQYCAGPACSDFQDMASNASAPLYVSGGSQPQTQSIILGSNASVSWNVRSAQPGQYRLRVRATPAMGDQNESALMGLFVDSIPESNPTPPTLPTLPPKPPAPQAPTPIPPATPPATEPASDPFPAPVPAPLPEPVPIPSPTPAPERAAPWIPIEWAYAGVAVVAIMIVFGVGYWRWFR